MYGAFPRVLGKYVREEKVLPLHEAVRKMTGRPAAVFGIEGRGVLRPGNYADIVVFDPATIIDKGTFTEPRQFPDGIAHVFVNGAHTVNGANLDTTALAGKVLRKK